MLSPSLGDLSQSFSLRQRNIALRAQIDRYTTELSTGRVSDVREVLAGNVSYLTDIERKVSVLTGYSVATTEARHYTSGQQLAVEDMGAIASDLSASLITAGTSAFGTARAEIATEARTALEALVARLNTNVSGRYVFAGDASDRPPLPSADTIMTVLSAAMAGATTPADMMTAAITFFDDPAGFDTLIYQGATDPSAPLALSERDNISLDLRALDPEIKRTLRLTAVAALAEDPAFGLSIPDQTALFSTAGQELLSARDGITSIGARIGFVEARIDTIISRNAAERTVLEFAKAELLEVDPFEAATRLQDVQFNLESLYRTTARNAQLSLVNFL